MKKLLTVVFAMFLACSLTFAQATGGSTDKTTPPAATSKKPSKTKTKSKKEPKGSKKTLNPQPLPPKPPAPNATADTPK
jgi:hypothetical protein